MAEGPRHSITCFCQYHIPTSLDIKLHPHSSPQNLIMKTTPSHVVRGVDGLDGVRQCVSVSSNRWGQLDTQKPDQRAESRKSMSNQPAK